MQVAISVKHILITLNSPNCVVLLEKSSYPFRRCFKYGTQTLKLVSLYINSAILNALVIGMYAKEGATMEIFCYVA